MDKAQEENNKLFKERCTGYKYTPLILPKKDRIIAIGDIHGDYNLAVECLLKAKVINKKLDWIGGKTVVVQVGDQIDSCRPMNRTCDNPLESPIDENSDLKIMMLFTKLNKKAESSGGAVYSLYGNHELMNIMGNLNYVSNKGFVDFYDEVYKEITGQDIKKLTLEEGKKAREEAFKPGGSLSKFIACTRKTSLIIGSFLFVHAGITEDFLKKMNIKDKDGLEYIDLLVKKWVLGLINKDYVDKIIGSYSYSMFWHRILGAIPPFTNNEHPNCVKYLNPVLDILKIKGMIIGHTPQAFSNIENINNTCGDSLWRVDFGGSFAFDKFRDDGRKGNPLRHVKVLEILNDGEQINIL